jgi:hypothetical protein
MKRHILEQLIKEEQFIRHMEEQLIRHTEEDMIRHRVQNS